MEEAAARAERGVKRRKGQPIYILGPKSIMIVQVDNALYLLIILMLMRVNIDNVLDEGLRIKERGHQMNSKVKDQTNRAELNVY
jgi:hypothetical protein